MTPFHAPTYTGRTQRLSAVYAQCRKSLSCLMGLRGVEPLTSRLSGPLARKRSVCAHSEITPVRASRRFRDESETCSVSRSARTQRVHTKGNPVAGSTGIGGHEILRLTSTTLQAGSKRGIAGRSPLAFPQGTAQTGVSRAEFSSEFPSLVVRP